MAVNQTRFGEEGSYEIRANERTNTLYLTFQGRLSKSTMAAAAEEALAAAADLAEGFRIVTDIAAYSPLTPQASEPIEAAQSSLKWMGVAQVVRVVGDGTSPVVEHSFARQWRTGDCETWTAPTVEAAERELGI